MPVEELARRMFWVGVGGASGALARFLVSNWTVRVWGSGYPWGTTVVNLAGSLLFGLIWAYVDQRDGSALWRVLLLTGFLGSFTTFSTFMFESVKLFESERPSLAVANLGLQTFVGLGCIVAGLWLGRLMVGGR